MERLQWGRIIALLVTTGLIFGIGILMQRVLPVYMPFFQSDFGQGMANVFYYLGVILFISSILCIGAVIYSGNKRKNKKQNNLDENCEVYEKKALDFIQALGGIGNIEAVDSCMSRVRANINDADQIDQLQIQSLGASGVFMSGSQIQAIFGDDSMLIKKEIDKILLEK